MPIPASPIFEMNQPTMAVDAVFNVRVPFQCRFLTQEVSFATESNADNGLTMATKKGATVLCTTSQGTINVVGTSAGTVDEILGEGELITVEFTRTGTTPTLTGVRAVLRAMRAP